MPPCEGDSASGHPVPDRTAWAFVWDWPSIKLRKLLLFSFLIYNTSSKKKNILKPNICKIGGKLLYKSAKFNLGAS
jgi:hypothetical protein